MTGVGAGPDTAPLVSCTGIVTVDTIFGVEHLPRSEGKLSATWMREVGGGVAANAAVAVARLGGRSRYVGCVGADERGATARALLAAEGVATDLVQDIEGRPTPTSAVLVDDDGARIIVNHVSDDFFARADPGPAAHMAGVDAVLVDLRWIAGAAATVAAAVEAGIPSIVDVDRPVAPDTGILQRASHLLFSHEALLAMTGMVQPDAALAAMASEVPGWVGVTLGDRGVWWLDGPVLRHQRAHDIVAVDTLAAGDTFHGAFALAVAEERSIVEAISFANAAAALKCTHPGGRSGIPTRADVDRFLASARFR